MAAPNLPTGGQDFLDIKDPLPYTPRDHKDFCSQKSKS